MIIIEKGATNDGSPENLDDYKNNRSFSQDWAVIFASWNHAGHADNQDYRKLHKAQLLQSGH